MKFPDKNNSTASVYSQNMVFPGCKQVWGASAVFRNPKTGEHRLADFDNNLMVKSKTVDRMEHDSLQLSFQLEVPEI